MPNVSKKFAVASYVLLAILALANVPRMLSQAVSIATVTGRIADPSGAVVVGAQVKITAVDTATVHVAVTDSAGAYSFPSLTIGAYTLEVTAPGFQTYIQKGIKLQVNDAPQINTTLKVGAVSDKVEVQADATMVQTQQNMVSQVMDQQRIVDLPLNGRDPTQLITI